MKVAFCLAALAVLTAHGAEDAELSETDLDALKSALPSAAETEAWVVAFARLQHQYGDKLFDRYNRFHDTGKSSGQQALGVQEVRALLKEIGIGNFALRGELASLVIRISDADGDGRISKPELSTTLEVVGCWVPAAADDAADDAVLTASRRLSTRVVEALSARSVNGGRALIRDELHSCGVQVRAWWASGWAVRLAAEELASTIVREDLLLEPSSCATALVQRVMTHGTTQARKVSNDERTAASAGHMAIRKALKVAGVESLLVRHAVATALIAALDTSGDGRLAESELSGVADNVCAAYSAVHNRGCTAVAALRALTLPAPDGYPPEKFVADLQDGDLIRRLPDMPPKDHAAALRATSEPDASQPLAGSAAALALIRTSMNLVPKTALALESAAAAAKEEL